MTKRNYPQGDWVIVRASITVLEAVWVRNQCSNGEVDGVSVAFVFLVLFFVGAGG